MTPARRSLRPDLVGIVLLLFWAGMATAQDFGARVRVDPVTSRVADAGEGVAVQLTLSQPVPWRVYTLTDPDRLAVEFREVDWSGLTAADLLRPGLVEDLSFDIPRPGWSRLVAPVTVPLALEQAGMQVDSATGAAVLSLDWSPTTPELFAANAGGPEERQLPTPALPAPDRAARPMTIAIDPGHGGVDPGAMRDGAVEAHLMLSLAIELAEAINREGIFRAVLTRQDDSFVPLATRMTIARAAGADALMSLHADALEAGGARGASVYTLNAAGATRASERMAERHEREDLIAGLDLTGQDDRVASVLMDLARAQTRPASEALAQSIVTGLRGAGARLNTRPRRDGRLAVLNAADFPSVLVEVGFLSDAVDRAALSSAAGRAPIVAGLHDGLRDWGQAQAARAPLLRR
ncbi:N-acetylmuramoyl-L-alanine amidase [Salipiger sp. IMCC34102]|uniref:N-acetylmuramoyl-L-alanine amidase n=1 Tax=Salipiger sp. IMCC34102 TaxID=2510647 RepID=UPI00101C6F26|nr:N-acetylmuramoyl-L-alanine amidase [Salipiger sp. IMCC34102]RYH02982.1 N-acetylmuramoyl-L-alanine amidase [Salipiger sp. IMCC34102]